jgi:hypothetical protein
MRTTGVPLLDWRKSSVCSMLRVAVSDCRGRLVYLCPVSAVSFVAVRVGHVTIRMDCEVVGVVDRELSRAVVVYLRGKGLAWPSEAPRPS